MNKFLRLHVELDSFHRDTGIKYSDSFFIEGGLFRLKKREVIIKKFQKYLIINSETLLSTMSN